MNKIKCPTCGSIFDISEYYKVIENKIIKAYKQALKDLEKSQLPPNKLSGL